MFRYVVKRSLALNLFTFFAPADIGSPDNLAKATETERKADLSVIKDETGWDRLKRMFEVDEFGEISKEVVTILHVGAMSLFVGAVYGGVMHSRTAYMDFIRNNQATIFHDHLEAKKRLQDAVTKSFSKGAWKWGWRLSVFCSTFVGISTTISVYRGKTGILDYVTAGVVSGTLYKFNMGPRGWLVGGGLGGALGLVGGLMTLGILNLTGMTMEEARYWQYHWRKERETYLQKGMADYLAKEEPEEYLYHTQKVGSDKTLENLEKTDTKK